MEHSLVVDDVVDDELVNLTSALGLLAHGKSQLAVYRHLGDWDDTLQVPVLVRKGL